MAVNPEYNEYENQAPVEFTLNGQTVTAKNGETILQAAKKSRRSHSTPMLYKKLTPRR